MSWASCFLSTNQPGWSARVDLPLVISPHTPPTPQRRLRGWSGWAILVLPGWRSGDALRVRDGSCGSGSPRLVVGSGGLRSPAVWLDPVSVQQLPQALDLAVQVVVFLDDRGQVHPGHPFLLPRRQPRLQLPFLVAQDGRLLEVVRVDRGLLVPPHLG